MLLPPHHSPTKAPLPVWVIRVWENDPPVEVEALEWVLITSVSTKTLRAAWERRDWYSCRSLSEDYHQCLKTGCRIEQRQLQTAEGLLRLLGMLGPVAGHVRVAIWAGVEMVHLAGRPFGAAGCTSRRCLKAFIWRATYLRKTCG